MKTRKLCESELTEAALIKIFKITVFIVKKHWAHTTNFEDTVRLRGEDLHEQIFSEYLKLSESHKNATYLLQNSVLLFITEINKWMKDETIKKMKEHENYTLLLDEAADESNRSKLSLIAHVVEFGEVHNLFLSLLELRRCDAESIFKTVEAFLIRENPKITNVRFSGMNGCSTMARIYHGVRSHVEQCSGHLVYIHCRNHRLALFFTHVIPKYDNFVKFDSLLLNLYLLLKNSTVKSNIFEEVPNAYGLKLLKLIKAVTTRWLSHERVLDCYKALVALLDSIYLRKKEPAVR